MKGVNVMMPFVGSSNRKECQFRDSKHPPPAPAHQPSSSDPFKEILGPGGWGAGEGEVSAAGQKM